MYLLNNKRINIDAPFTDSNGTTYLNLRDPSLRATLGVAEVPDPVRPTPEEEFYITENEDGSLNVTPKSAEQIAAIHYAKAKVQRESNVAAIKVTTTAGNEFDGDEISQGRMARAVIALGASTPGTTVNWILADNSVIQATAAELTEALALAGAAQASLWVLA